MRRALVTVLLILATSLTFAADRPEGRAFATRSVTYARHGMVGAAHPLAVQAMSELGIDIATRRSKSTKEFRDMELDTVVTVCDDAAENCPVWLGKGRQVHRGFEDPALAIGNYDERLAVFRQVRDGIRARVLDYLVGPGLAQSCDSGLEVYFATGDF